MFIYLLNVFNGMPGGWCVEIVFYVCVLFAGLSSLVNLYEAPVEDPKGKLYYLKVQVEESAAAETETATAETQEITEEQTAATEETATQAQ